MPARKNLREPRNPGQRVQTSFEPRRHLHGDDPDPFQRVKKRDPSLRHRDSKPQASRPNSGRCDSGPK